MPQIGSFLAWIEVENKKLPEYKIQYSADGKEATCWIPSEAGKAFIISVKDSVRKYTTGTSIIVDGLPCTGKILRSKATHPLRRDTCTHRGFSVSDHSYKPYIFSNCELIDDDNFDPSLLRPAIGDIKVVVDRVVTHRHTKPRKGSAPYELSSLRVNEKDKKGIVHGTQLGPEVARRRRKWSSTKTIQHIATFIFKYRPITVLQADGIAPPPGRNEHGCRGIAPNYHEVIDLTAQDEDDVPRRSKTLSVKMEVKQERSMTLHGDIIDLTQDG